jgi:hypothetical protein
MSFWFIRVLFLLLTTVAGYACSQYRPEVISGWRIGLLIGFGLGATLIVIDHLLK